MPGNADYETARVNWSGTYDHHPAMIVPVVDAEDVRLAVKFAYEQGMAQMMEDRSLTSPA